MVGRTNGRRRKGVTVQPFAYYGTHLDELETVLQAHYNGKVDLSTIWSVGDTMTDISLGAISTSSLGGDSQPAQNIDLVILDFNHDILTSDTSKKAAITVGQLNCLSTGGKFFGSYGHSDYSRYKNSERSSWLNNNYYNALPSALKALVKPVQKSMCYGSSRQVETLSETCWLASNWEIFAANYDYLSTTCTAKDGTQYPYYQTQSNRIKKKGKTGSAFIWWTRSGWYDGMYQYAYFMSCGSNGSQGHDVVVNSCGLVPHFCL